MHSVTNYHLHKALYSGHNDHNYFEIAHTVKRLYGMGGNRPDGLKLYNFVDNHDVERIYTKLNNKAHFAPVHVLLYTLPGVPSIYYGSEFGIEGKKEKFSDASLRPALRYEDYANAVKDNPCTRLIAALGRVRQQARALSYGDYKELVLTNRQYAFSRGTGDETVLVTVNNDDNNASLTLPACGNSAYVGALSGVQATADGDNITVNLPGCSGEIWLPVWDGVMPAVDGTATAQAGVTSAGDSAPDKGVMSVDAMVTADAGTMAAGAAITADAGTMAAGVATAADAGTIPVDATAAADGRTVPADATITADAETIPAVNNMAVETSSAAGQIASAETQNRSIAVETTPDSPSAPLQPAAAPAREALDEAFEKGKIAGLQEAILAIMSKNGPITDQMRRDVADNVYHDSLINWIKSFR